MRLKRGGETHAQSQPKRVWVPADSSMRTNVRMERRDDVGEGRASVATLSGTILRAKQCPAVTGPYVRAT